MVFQVKKTVLEPAIKNELDEDLYVDCQVINSLEIGSLADFLNLLSFSLKIKK